MSSSRRVDGTTERIPQGTASTHLIRLAAVRLQVVAGPCKGQEWICTEPCFRIGTSPDNEIVLEDPAVSRSHARIQRRTEGLVLTDLGSRNGTFVTKVKIQEGVLQEGAEFTVGNSTIRVAPTEERHVAIADDRLDRMGGLVGGSPAMREVYSLLQAAAPTRATVLLRGETGTGKEVAARLLHEASKRQGPFVILDCGRAQPDLLASEMFGHAKGAFTGADREREGAFRRAQGGTLFIDEIGELPMSLQTMFLRVLESREVQPLGTDRSVRVDFRLVAATNRDLEVMVNAGTFREDLFHRISIIPVVMPPLRERVEDIPHLLAHFQEQMGLDCGFSHAAIALLKSLPWSGNVRAFRNALERIGIQCQGRQVELCDLGHLGAPRVPDRPLKSLEEHEKDAIVGTFEALRCNKKRTARVLGISVARLRRRLRDYGLETADDPGDDDDLPAPA